MSTFETDVLATTYYHTATITRPKPIVVDGLDEFEDVLIATVPCAVSFRGTGSAGESDTTQAIEYVATLFVRPEIDIAAGDNVVADVHGQRYEFLCGELARYPSHLEVPLIRKGRA